MINEICKGQCADKLLAAQKKEGLSNHEVGEVLGLAVTEISMIKNKKFWFKISEKKWEGILKWINSGERLRKYGDVPENVASEEKAPIDPEKDQIEGFKLETVHENGMATFTSDTDHKESSHADLEKYSAADNVGTGVGWHLPTKQDVVRIEETVHKNADDVVAEAGNSDTIQSDEPLIAEKKEKKPINDYVCSVNLAQLGWIISSLKKGSTVEAVAKKLKIYDRIVEIIHCAIVDSAERGDEPKTCVPVTQVVTIDLRILINGEPVKIG